METWKTIEEPDFQMKVKYEISSKGRVRNPNGRLLSTWPSDTGYTVVNITCFGGNKKCKVHRLVAKAFIPNPDNKLQVNHKDGDKLNNCVDNLEWVTASENIQHSLKNGLIKSRREECIDDRSYYLGYHRGYYAALTGKNKETCKGSS